VTPLIRSVKSSASFVPPLSLSTCLMTVIVGVPGAGGVPVLGVPEQASLVSPSLCPRCAFSAGLPAVIVFLPL
jgi:hypothetical protein